MIWLQSWVNWPFLLAIFVGLGLVALTLLGLGKDVDGGVDLDGDGVPDVGGHAHAETDGHHHEPGHVHLAGLGWLGLGKAPLSILLQALLLSFGFIGLTLNAVAHDVLGGFGVAAFPVALFGAIGGSLSVTRGVAALFYRFMPPEQATGPKSGEYAGKTGVTASRVTRAFGQVTVSGDQALLNAATDDGVIDDIPRGTEVYLVRYDTTRHLYRVAPLPTPDT